MTLPADSETGAIGLAEKILTLLDQGRFTATYKYAVLLGLMDLCLERTSGGGEPPDTVTTRQLAEKIIELYWPHTAPYDPSGDLHVLRQNAGTGRSQAEIVAAIERFRNRAGSGVLAPLARVKLEHRRQFERLVDKVEWKLIEMPLPKLQRIGGREHRFLYEIGWDDGIQHQQVRRYQQGEQWDFDNRILFKPGVSDALVRLNGLLRPLIHKQWTLKVAQINGLPEARLEAFLFGAERAATDDVRGPLEDMQAGRCFYCEGRLQRAAPARPEVDHFIPWARYPDNGLANLVVAHEGCNRAKRDFLAANDHVEKWLARNRRDGEGVAALHAISDERNWELRREEMLGVASAVYLSLPDDAELWRRKSEFELVERERLERAFGDAG